MQGFSPEFESPEHYILDITERIWSSGGVGLIRSWYSDDCVVHTPFGSMIGPEPVIRSTLVRRQEFPDRVSLHEDVLIGPRESGFYSSHRPRMLATHLGNGSFGQPTGYRVASLGIADCLCRDNQIVEEWLVRDQAGFAQSLGLDLESMASQRVAAATGNALEPASLLNSWADSDGTRITGDQQTADFVIDGWRNIWNENRSDYIFDLYDSAAVVEVPTNSTYQGLEQIDCYISGLMSSFPEKQFRAHHVVVRRDVDYAPTVAIRWSIETEHSGPGPFGQPSGAPVAIIGISHVELRNGKIIREWTVFDALSIHAQILRFSGKNG